MGFKTWLTGTSPDAESTEESGGSRDGRARNTTRRRHKHDASREQSSRRRNESHSSFQHTQPVRQRSQSGRRSEPPQESVGHTLSQAQQPARRGEATEDLTSEAALDQTDNARHPPAATQRVIDKKKLSKDPHKRRHRGFFSSRSKEEKRAKSSPRESRTLLDPSMVQKELPQIPGPEIEPLGIVETSVSTKSNASSKSAPEAIWRLPETLSIAHGPLEAQPWEEYLPQSTDDETIADTVERLFVHVDQHIGNFYSSADCYQGISKDVAEDLEMLHCPIPGASLLEVLESTSEPDMVLRHCLNHLLLSGISFDKTEPFSLLPEEFTALPQAIRNSKSMSNRDPRGRKEAFSRYRVFSCFLWQTVAIDEQYTHKRNGTIVEVAEMLTRVFRPWETSTNDVSRRLSSLKGILHKTADLGLLLYRQPSVFYFHWAVSEAPHRIAIAISPRLLKVEDESARTISPPQLMVDMRSTLLSMKPDPPPAPIDKIHEMMEPSVALCSNVSSLSYSLPTQPETHKPRKPDMDVAYFSQPIEAHTFGAPGMQIRRRPIQYGRSGLTITDRNNAKDFRYEPAQNSVQDLVEPRQGSGPQFPPSSAEPVELPAHTTLKISERDKDLQSDFEDMGEASASEAVDYEAHTMNQDRDHNEIPAQGS